MRILFIHPEDALDSGPWTGQTWHRIFDLGQGSAESYRRLSRRQGCPAVPLNSFGLEFDEFARVRELLASGRGELLDECGLDWWELTSLMLHRQLETLILLRRAAGTLNPDDKVYISRPGFHFVALQYLFGSRAHALSGATEVRGMRHYFQVLRRFRRQQLLEIFWDKTDAGYQFRGRFARPCQPAKTPLVLLPTAYANASRSAVAYAQVLSQSKFLLVATRRSGWLNDLPPHVSAAWLRSYASLGSSRRKTELAHLVDRWRLLRLRLEEVPEFAILNRAGWLENFPQQFRQGLEIRDAWRTLLEREPVQSVLCADDSNPYTRIPLLLARERGLPSMVCHHGALDGRYLFKRPHADVILAKGRMEEEYLVKRCGLPRSKVEIGAPPDSVLRSCVSDQNRNKIVFFSEPYEISEGRTRDIYQEILPPLAELASASKRELIVKLHPFETAGDRCRLIDQILPSHLKAVTRMVSGPLDAKLLGQTWFGVTVLSSAAMDCALHGVPCFLCRWLRFTDWGYADQFVQFRIALALTEPGQLMQIPHMLASQEFSMSATENWRPAISSERLRELLIPGTKRVREGLAAASA